MIQIINQLIKTSLVIVLLVFTNAIQAQKSKEIKPKKFVSTVHMSGSSDFIYYALSEKVKTTITVAGPGKLTVYNRVRLENSEQLSTPYYLKYIIDHKKVATKKIGPQKLSKKVKYKSNKLKGKPSKADKEVITIPPGKHSITFYKYKTKQKAHARFEFLPTEKLNWKELTYNVENKVELQYLKTKKKNYYTRIDNSNFFRFSTNPENSKIRIFLRADFTYKMHTNNTIRLVLKTNNGLVKTYKLTTKKSSSVENLTDSKLIPGKLEKIYLDIPIKGNQVYELSLKDVRKSALVRVFLDLPKKEKMLSTASK